MGTANLCDVNLLKPGMACWILVDPANTPQGIWRGEVIEVAPQGSYLETKAKITHTTDVEWMGREPNVNYRVIPATVTMDAMVKEILSLRRDLKTADSQAGLWREAALARS